MRDTRLWTWHIAAGAVILVLLALHMWTMHLNQTLPVQAFNPAGEDPLDWANVVARGEQVIYAVGYVLLLGAAMFHGLYGLRNILFELDPGEGGKKTINAILLILGIGLFAVGTWAAIAARGVALTAGM
ncbi:MAG: hypothetical protein R6W82_10325 [bacterium]